MYVYLIRLKRKVPLTLVTVWHVNYGNWMINLNVTRNIRHGLNFGSFYFNKTMSSLFKYLQLVKTRDIKVNNLFWLTESNNVFLICICFGWIVGREFYMELKLWHQLCHSFAPVHNKEHDVLETQTFIDKKM